MKNALVLYYSCSNNTKAIAKYTENVLKDRKWNVKISNLDLCKTRNNFTDIDLLIVGVSCLLLGNTGCCIKNAP